MYILKTQNSANFKILPPKKWSACKFDKTLNLLILFADDILWFFYVVSHLGRCVRTHVLTCYNISWLLSALL